MRAQIRHVTTYHYPQAASDSFNELRLQPAQIATQSLLGFQLYIDPDTAATSHTDYFGMTVHSFHVKRPHSTLRVETHAVVVTHAAPLPLPTLARTLEPYRNRFYDYLEPSERVPRGQWTATLEVPDMRDDDDLLEYLRVLNTRIRAGFTYAPGATGVGTTLIDFVAQRTGVCQDYAHLMLAVCREQRIPARYVSGYIYAGREFVGAGATHAWVECFIPNTDSSSSDSSSADSSDGVWLGFDPTNGVLQTEYHIVIGWGRDYNDVTPMKGSRRGGGAETLTVAVSVQVQQ